MDYLKKSRIEEVLIAILGKGTVTSQLISRIEKILDAIRTDGSYDGIVMSEVEEILVCILLGKRFEKPTHSRIAAMLKVKANGGEYTELRKSRVEELIFEWINAVEYATYTGTLPATLQTVAGYLESYKIYGNTVQKGTPTPENPIMPIGCGERTENLINVQPFTIESDGRSHYVPLWSGTLPVGTYTISLNQYNNLVSALRNTLRITIGDTTSYEAITSDYHLQSGRHKMTFAISDSSQSIEIQYWGNQLSNDCSYTNIMLNLGSTALPYIPYGYKLPILSNSTVTNIYLGEVETTRRIKKLVLTGEEQYIKDDNSVYLYYIYCSHMYHTNCLCSHLRSTTGYPTKQEGCSTYNSTLIIYLNFGADIMESQPSGNTVAGLKEYLAAQYAAGTPVTVWYVLAEPETGIVNEPLMKIGDYADTLDSTQTSVQIPTVAGETTISWAGEGLAPSEVEMTYLKPK